MFSRAILLCIIVPLSLAIQDTPLVRFLPEDRFSASSSYNESVTASNVRFPSEHFGFSASKEPWCPVERNDYNYFEEYVAVDLRCQQTVRKLEGKASKTLQYSGEYSNDKKKWKKLTSKDETYYDKILKAFQINHRAVIQPPVKARYFRFRIRMYDYSPGLVPCLKVEMYGSSPCEPEKPVEPEIPVEPIGCFTEAKKRVLPIVYYTINGPVGKKCSDILDVYEECKQKAAESSKPLEIFGIWSNKKSAKCVTTKTGKFHEYFNKAPDSSNCKTCEGKGIGSKKAAVFVYKK